MDTEKNNYDVNKILKYNDKYIMICNIILVICIIVSLLLVKVTDSLSNGKGNRVILTVVKNDKQLKEVYSAISKKIIRY